MAVATYPSIAFSQSTTAERDQTIIESIFGDGYSQRAADGLNSKKLRLRVIHENITQAELNTLMTFWNSVGRVSPFYVVNPYDGLTYKVRFNSPFSVTPHAGSIYSVSAELIQTFDLTS